MSETFPILDAVDAEAARLARSGEVDDATRRKLLADAKGDPRAYAHLLVAHAWRDKPLQGEPEARESRLRLAAALVDARAGKMTKTEAKFLAAALRARPDTLARLPAADALVLRLAMRTAGVPPPDPAPSAPPTTAQAIATMRERLKELGATDAQLDALRKAVKSEPLELRALVETELRLLGFETRALATPEGVAEARMLSEAAAHARVEGTLTSAHHKFLRERMAKDKDYLLSCGTRGDFAGHMWRPLLTAPDIVAIQKALQGPSVTPPATAAPPPPDEAGKAKGKAKAKGGRRA